VKPWQEAPIPQLDFANVARSGDIVLRAERLAMAYGSKQLFTNLSFSIRRGERWAIRGANGGGKSMPLRALQPPPQIHLAPRNAAGPITWPPCCPLRDVFLLRQASACHSLRCLSSIFSRGA